MSDNIVGKDHLDYVKKQITSRQEILGKRQKTPEDLAWTTGRTSWIRLISSVDIQDQPRFIFTEEGQIRTEPDNGAEYRNTYLNLEGYNGNELAKENILQAGTLNLDQPKFGVLDEINQDGSIPSSPNTNINYGFGGGQFGLKPMPGITSFTSKTYNRGSLRKATLQITAHNTQQFQQIESLYMRLGYTMLLEWGNSKYVYTKDDGFLEYSTTSDISSLSLRDEFLDSFDKGTSYFYTRIEELRKQSQGNYDGFLGKVDNFSWEFTKSGTYLITLDLITIGSVVESLKLNTNIENIEYPSGVNQNTDSTSQIRAYALEVGIDLISRFTPNIYEKENKTSVSATTLLPGQLNPPKKVEVNEFLSTKKLLTQDEAKALQTKQFAFFEDFITPPSPSPVTTPSSTANPPRPPETRVMACNAFYGQDNVKQHFYIRLGTLLGFINEKLLAYGKNENFSFIEIDAGINNFCYSNGYSFSGDPSKMINKLERNLNNLPLKAFPDIEPFHDILGDGTKVGNIMNLYFERDYLHSIIANNKDENGNIYLYSFLKKIAITINNLLGNVNKINLRIVDKNFNGVIKEVLEFYDEVPFIKTVTNPVFNIYGFDPNEFKTVKTTKIDEDGNPIVVESDINYNGGSFITDYKLQTQISKKLSTQIAIGAQAQGRAIGEDSTIFSYWNTGLVDRVLPTKLDITKAIDSQLESQLDFIKLKNNYLKFLSKLSNSGNKEFYPSDLFTSTTVYKGYGFPNLYVGNSPDTSTNFKLFKEIQSEFFVKVISFDALAKKIATPFIGFLPINLSLTMDGLSGIRIFDKLTIDTRFLPSNYGDSLNFIITELDHKFEGNKWITEVGTLSIPKLFDKTAEVFLEEPITEAIVPEEGTSDDLINESYFYSDYPIITGQETGKKVSVNEILLGLNTSPEVQNKFQSFLIGLIELIPTGYEIRITSAFRDFIDINRVYLKDVGITDPIDRLYAGLKSPHTYGLALDISLYEIDPNNPGKSTKLIAGKPKQFVKVWNSLGIVGWALKNGLRWGGTFKNKDGTPFYDCVHFDAAPLPWPSNASKIGRKLYNDYPNIEIVMKYGFKTNFKDFGLGDIYSNLSLKDFVNISGGQITSYNDPTIVGFNPNGLNLNPSSIFSKTPFNTDLLAYAILVAGAKKYRIGNDEFEIDQLYTP